jgi:hypothetical protein
VIRWDENSGYFLPRRAFSVFIDKVRGQAYLLLHINTEFQSAFSPIVRRPGKKFGLIRPQKKI